MLGRWAMPWSCELVSLPLRRGDLRARDGKLPRTTRSHHPLVRSLLQTIVALRSRSLSRSGDLPV
jgi:hypothetical protein